MRPGTALVGSLLVACAATLLAERSPQQPASTQAPEATFRSAVDLAQIDVIVTDGAGNPVPGLTAGDFELLENGVAREIAAFDAVDLPIARTSASLIDREPDVSSNARAPDRVYMFALDEVAPCNALRTRHFLRQFMDQYFGPNDVAAVALVGTGLATGGQDFTSNRRLLLQAIDKFSGGFDPGCPGRHTPPGTLRSGRSQQLAGLRALTESLARIPARRKAMLLFTQQLDIDMFDVVDYSGGVLGLAGEDAHAILRAATTANIAIYPIDPTGLTPHHIPIGTLASLSALGHATGGFSLSNSNSFAESFERIVRENSTYYLLGYDSAYGDDNGRYVRVNVNVKRPGLQVQARRGFVAASRRERRTERETDSGSAVASALASPLAAGGVTLRAVAVPRRGSDGAAIIDLAVEIDTSMLPLVERDGRLTGPVDVRYVVTSHRDKSFPEVRYATSLDLDPAAAATDRFVRMLTQFELRPGRYQLRVAAGNDVVAGSVVHDIEVPDYRDGPLTMSGVTIVSRPDAALTTFHAPDIDGPSRKARRCRPPLCPDDFVAARRAMTTWTAKIAAEQRGALPAPMTTRRTFTPADTVILYAEAYDNRKAGSAGAAGNVELTVGLHDAGGEIVRVVRDSRPSIDGEERYAFTMRLPIDGLQPGAYVLHVTAHSGENVVRRVLPMEIASSGK